MCRDLLVNMAALKPDANTKCDSRTSASTATAASPSCLVQGLCPLRSPAEQGSHLSRSAACSRIYSHIRSADD